MEEEDNPAGDAEEEEQGFAKQIRNYPVGWDGEPIPYWLYRLDWMAKNFPMRRPQVKLAPSEYFKRNFMITTSGVNWLPALRFCIEVLSADNIMFAVDYPYQETMEAVQWLKDAPLPEVYKEKIFHKNAERVFRIAPGG